MNNKKLIIINLLTFIAFVFVVGAGIYQASSMKDKYGKEKRITENEEAEETKAKELKIVVRKEIDRTLAERMEPLGTRAIRDIDFVALRENDETKDELEVEEAYVEEDMGTVDIDTSNNSAQATSPVEEDILEKGIKSSDQTNSTTKSSSNEKATSTSVEKNTSSGNSQGNGSAHTRNSREDNPVTKEKDSNEGEDTINMKEGEGSKHDYEDENETAGDISDDDPGENRDEEKEVKEEMDEDKDLENQSN